MSTAIGGHSVAYEVENGKVVIHDAQSIESFSESEAKSFLGMAYPGSSSFGRTDNLEINWDNINRAVMRYDEEDPKHK